MSSENTVSTKNQLRMGGYTQNKKRLVFIAASGAIVTKISRRVIYQNMDMYIVNSPRVSGNITEADMFHPSSILIWSKIPSQKTYRPPH